MKIAYITNSRFPSEKAQSDQVMAMCSAFSAAGHEVTLYVPDRKPVMAENPFAYYGRPASFTFERVPCLDALRFPWLRNIGLWIQTFTFIRRLRPRLRAFRPDVVYSREPYVFAFGAISGLHVWESHAFHHSAWSRSFLRRLNAVVALTEASKERLVRTGLPTDRILVEADAVDPSLFAGAPSREEARAALKWLPSEFVFLYTGKFLTMGMPKGLAEACEAVAALRRERRNVRFVAVGGAEADMKRYARFGAQEGVMLLPHVPQGELKRFYAAADALLMPFPHTEHYAFHMSPLKLFEYLRAARPIVVTNLPSVREVVDERSAFIAQPGDAVSLATEMRRLMDNPEAAKARASAAFALSARYTWEARAKRIADFLLQIRSLIPNP